MATGISASGFDGLEEITLDGNDITRSIDLVFDQAKQAAQEAQNQKKPSLFGSYFSGDTASSSASVMESTSEFDISEEDLRKIENGEENTLSDLTIPDYNASKAETPKKTNKVAKALIITAFVLGALIVIAGIAAAALIILGPTVGLPAVALPFALV